MATSFDGIACLAPTALTQHILEVETGADIADSLSCYIGTITIVMKLFRNLFLSGLLLAE